MEKYSLRLATETAKFFLKHKSGQIPVLAKLTHMCTTPYPGIVKQAEATVACAEDGGRLLSINTCEEMAGLQIDLWRQNPTITTSYWVGIFNSGFQNYEGQKRTSKSQVTINSR